MIIGRKIILGLMTKDIKHEYNNQNYQYKEKIYLNKYEKGSKVTPEPKEF